MKNLKWNQIVGSILLGAGLGLAGFSLLLSNNLFSSRLKAFVVTSGSMEPAIKTGSVVFTRSSPSYVQGDVISFYPDTNKKTVVTHRVAAKLIEGDLNSPVYLTSGDANEEIDNWKVTESQIIGKVSLNIPYIGFVVDFAKTPKGFVALVIIPASIIIYEELKTLFKEFRVLLARIFRKFRKTNSPDSQPDRRIVLLFPIFVLFLLFASVSSAYFFDDELSLGNTLGVATTYGTPLPSSSSSPAPSPAPQNLVINEFMPNPIGENEWVEIYNPTSQEVSLVGWALDEGDQNPKPLDLLTSIPAGGFVVYQHTSTIWLDNAGETLELLLLNPTSQIVDTHTYTSSTPGVSIGRETDGSSNWRDCSSVSENSSNNSLCL